MRAGAWAGDSFGGGKGTPPKPGDGALAAKMRTQRRRLTLIACGVFFPACLVLLLFNGPRDGVVLAAQVAAFAAMAFSLFVIVRARRRY
jgi:Mn2+/Fe2+ NRAMP family transporter